MRNDQRPHLPVTHAKEIRLRSSGGGTAEIWIPWMVAPLFALMPIGGCALANTYRKSAGPSAAVSPVVPMGAVVTAGRE